jgi:preprotein translocase subunit SecE
VKEREGKREREKESGYDGGSMAPLNRTTWPKFKVIFLSSESVYVKSSVFSVFIFLSFYLGCLFVVFVHYVR